VPGRFPANVQFYRTHAYLAALDAGYVGTLAVEPMAKRADQLTVSESDPIERGARELGRRPDQLYRLLVDSVEDYAIFALDPHGNIVSWNTGAERINGYTAEEAIGRHFSLFYPADRVAARFPDYELREADRVGRFEDEGWRLRKDGTRFWSNVVITALRDQAGKLIGFAKVTRDLTDRRAAEEALRASDERFRILVQGVRDYAIFMLDAKGYVATWNPGVERIKGYTADELVGKHFSIFYTPEDLADHKPERELAIATAAGVYEEEGWRVRKDGTRFWANVVITALRDAEGNLAGFGKVTRDLTERRASQERAIEDARRVAAEEAARRISDRTRERAQQLQSITAELAATHTLPEVAAVLFGPGLRAVGAVAGALGLLDEAGSSVTLAGDGGHWQLPEWTRSIPLGDNVPLTEVVRTAKPVVCVSRAERDARFPRLAEVLAPYGSTLVFPLSARGGTVGSIAFHRIREGAPTADDLEFMKALAQQAAQAVERAMLSSAEQEARARADEANRAKSEFLASMSHELRTPLNAIAGYAELIDLGLRGAVTEEQRADLQRIKRSQQHLLRIINDILNYSRIEAGRTNYSLTAVPVREMLETVAPMILPQARAKRLEFIVQPCAPDLIVWADRARVEQILLNLMANAVKFTAEGSVSVGCGADSRGDVATITVADTGVGIPADQLERIFEPFVQVGRSLTNSTDGTGLGLAISRDLARAMAGDIRVRSEIGRGSEFTLTLPRSMPDPDEVRNEKTAATATR
jgi:PAS domain S-box-containing protein